MMHQVVASIFGDGAMVARNAIHLRKTIDSETLHLPELERFIGHTVDIVIEESVPAPLDIRARLDELRLVKDGWVEGGKAPSAQGLDWLAESLVKIYPDRLPLPRLFPTPEGGIEAEWILTPNDVSLEIDLSSHRAYWHVLNTSSGTDQERWLNLETPADWTWFLKQIEQMAGGRRD